VDVLSESGDRRGCADRCECADGNGGALSWHAGV